jgi:dihydroxy-acid dehydratase
VRAHKLNVRLTEEQLAERAKRWKPRPPRYTTGALGKYAKLATSADTGAVLKWQ